MSFIDSGYDLSASQYSPEGRVFQVEYAQKAVENSGTTIGLRGKDGVVFAAEKLVISKLYVASAYRRIFTIDQHVGVAVAGLMADARQIIEIAKEEAATYKSKYNEPVPLRCLKSHVSMHMHLCTLYGAIRPYGASVIMGTYECDGPQMCRIDPFGLSCGYFGCAIGKGKQIAETEMEKIDLKETPIVELVKEAAKIIYIVHEEANFKNFELDLSWVGEVTGGKHELVPPTVFKEAEEYARKAVDDNSD